MIKNLKLFTVLFLALTIHSCSNNDDDDYVLRSPKQFLNKLLQALITHLWHMHYKKQVYIPLSTDRTLTIFIPCSRLTTWLLVVF